MTPEDLKNYLKENLKIKVSTSYSASHYGQTKIVVTLLLDNDVISESIDYIN